jgi:pimeloyl-ACP methyl ester carboxylesterase
MPTQLTQEFVENRDFAYIRFDPPSAQLNSSNSRAVFMLHGFPGNLSRRNEDIGEEISKHLGVTVFLLHYRGLGRHNGPFSFLSTIEQAKSAFNSVKKDFQNWSIIGHSWGGLVAASLANEIPREQIEKVLLLSPFILIPETSELQEVLRIMQSEAPEIIGHSTLNELVVQLETIRKSNEPRTNLLKLNLPKEKLYILQASYDDVVLPQTTKSLIGLLRNKVNYEEMREDHSFLKNRTKVCARVLQVLR